jgi:tRNA-binding EMAP/Myf-like protein
MAESVDAYLATLKRLAGDRDPLSVLAETPSRLNQLLTGVEAAALRHAPAPGKWSIAEIVAHLADSELVFGYRLRTIFSTNGAHLQAFDPDRWADTFGYRLTDPHASAELFGSLRMGNLRMIRSAGAAGLDHTATHDEWGAETARGIIQLEAGHDLNHLAQIERILESAGPRPGFTPAAPRAEVPIALAEQIDLRVGTIVAMVPIAGADRLMQITVDFGGETRLVVAGIRQERPDPQVLIGRQALFYYNLPKKTIRGHVSEAMLCDAGFADGIVPVLLEPEWPVPNGTRAG